MSSPVQSAKVSGTGVTSQTITLNGVTAGNCLVLLVAYADVAQTSSAVPATPTDSNGTVSVAVNPTAQINAGSLQASGTGIFFVPNCASGTHTLTVNPFSNASSLYVELSLTEWSVLTTTPLDVATSNGSNTAASSTTGNTGTTGALAQSASLVFSVVSLLATTGVAEVGISDPPAGTTKLFVQQDTASTVGAEGCYSEPAVTTGQITTWTWVADASQLTWQAAISVFKKTTTATTTKGRALLLGVGM